MLGRRLQEMADLSDNSLKLMGNINKISLGDWGIGVKDMVDSINDILELGGNIGDHTTFGSRGDDFADLSDNSLKLFGNINKISLGDWGIGVKDMVDSINDILELGGNISDDTTLGSRLQEMADLSDNSLKLMGNINKISLGGRGIGVKNMVDSINDILELGSNIGDDTTLGPRGQDFADFSDNSLN